MTDEGLDDRVALAQMVSLAERQIVDDDAGDDVGTVAGSECLVQTTVERIPVAAEVIDLLAECVAEVEGEPLRKPPVDRDLERVIGRVPAIAP